MLIKIVFDTNVLSTGNFNEVRSVNDFLEVHKSSFEIRLCIPEIALKEWGQHQEMKIVGLNTRAKQTIKELEECGHSKVPIENIDPITYTKELTAKLFKEFTLELIPIPDLEQEELLGRAISKIPPFNPKTENKKGSDYGFKDTILFLSLRDDSNKYEKDSVLYILMSNDGGFSDTVIKEFNNEKRELIIQGDSSKLRDELDSRLGLGLNLAEKREAIEKIASEKRDAFDIYLLTRASKENFIVHASRENVDGYTFSSFYIDTFEETSKDQYKVRGRIVADVIYKETENEQQKPESSVWGADVAYHNPFTVVDTFRSSVSGWGQAWRSPIETFWVDLEVNIPRKEVRIL